MTINKIHTSCYHCGDKCLSDIKIENKNFCCEGCKYVYELLQSKDLCTYYDLNNAPGIKLRALNNSGKFDFLTEKEIESEFLNFQSESLNIVTLYIPSIHCSSCVWILENLKSLLLGVKSNSLNFTSKKLNVHYDPKQVSLKEIAEFLSSIGYEPVFNISNAKAKPKNNQLVFQLALAGFCTANTMIFSFPEYLNLDADIINSAKFNNLFNYLNLGFSIHLVFISAKDYLVNGLNSFKAFLFKNSKVLSLETPISIGILTLFIFSTYQVLVLKSPGYFDSLAGLIFFLLAGKYFQTKTYEYLDFEHEYGSFLPIAVKVIKGAEYKYSNIGDLKIGDKIELINQELIPTDGVLVSDDGELDYSFVSGEPDTLAIKKGQKLFAGGKVQNSKILMQVSTLVKNSYWLQLWNNDNYNGLKENPNLKVISVFSKYFTFITLVLALLTALYWYNVDKSQMCFNSVAVLIVACPCAFTLALPFSMSTAMSLLGSKGVFAKNQNVLLALNEVDTLVFDKTGTLTENKKWDYIYSGQVLNHQDKKLISSLASYSTHPLAKQLQHIHDEKIELKKVNEIPGKGIVAFYKDIIIKLGKESFVKDINESEISGSVHISINNSYFGYFSFSPGFREHWQQTLTELKDRFRLILLSGDNANSQSVLSPFFDKLLFKKSPFEKLEVIKNLKTQHSNIAMIGDGLNDAGAFKEANVGISLRHENQAFTPSCDIILESKSFANIPLIFNLIKGVKSIVFASFILSLIYNGCGLYLAVNGFLSPMIAAIFMPLSSISVVVFSVFVTKYWFKKSEMKWK